MELVAAVFLHRGAPSGPTAGKPREDTPAALARSRLRPWHGAITMNEVFAVTATSLRS